MKKSLYLYLSFLVLGLSLFFIINSVFAWTLPTANPPYGDLPAPLDTSSIEQTKAGNLNLDNNLKVGGLLRLGLYTSHPTGTNGNLYYNTSDHKFYGYQNNEWKELGGGSFWLANGNNIYNTNTGNVGIGTTAPEAKLEVAGQVKITGGSPGANKVLTSDASGLATWQTITGTLPSGTSGQTLRHDGTNWVANSVIYNNGTNVGIGTTSPTNAKLHLEGSGTYDGVLRLKNTGTSGANVFFVASNSDWSFGANKLGIGLGDPSSGNVKMTIQADGNVGIGTTSPGAKLEVAGHIWQTGTGDSVFLGEGAGANDNLDYNENVFVGYQAGFSNTTGWNNSAMGNNALYSNTDGYSNSAMGNNALNKNTTGYQNSAMGYQALYSNTTGDYNSVMGNNALYSNTDGNSNSAMGYNALNKNTTGSFNSAMGHSALYSNTTSGGNSAMGANALYSNTTGRYNSAIGNNALFSNTTGDSNSAMGYNALFSNTTGYQNSAMGYSAGRYISGGSVANATSTNSVYLGYDTRALASGDTNEIVIGASTTGFGSNTAAYGNSSMTKHIFQKGNVGIGTTAPDSTLELAGSNAALSLNEDTATPAKPASGAEARIYMKADKLIIQYNDAGTVRYKYLTLTGTGVTWTHTTTAP